MLGSVDGSLELDLHTELQARIVETCERFEGRKFKPKVLRELREAVDATVAQFMREKGGRDFQFPLSVVADVRSRLLAPGEYECTLNARAMVEVVQTLVKLRD
jgi:hypothetical protein